MEKTLNNAECFRFRIATCRYGPWKKRRTSSPSLVTKLKCTSTITWIIPVQSSMNSCRESSFLNNMTLHQSCTKSFHNRVRQRSNEEFWLENVRGDANSRNIVKCIHSVTNHYRCNPPRCRFLFLSGVCKVPEGSKATVLRLAAYSKPVLEWLLGGDFITFWTWLRLVHNIFHCILRSEISIYYYYFTFTKQSSSPKTYLQLHNVRVCHRAGRR